MNIDYKSMVALAGLVSCELANGSNLEELSAYKNFFSMVSTNFTSIIFQKGVEIKKNKDSNTNFAKKC